VAKNKGTHGQGRSAVAEEDEFISTAGRLGKALEPHAKKLVALVVVLLAGGAIAALLHGKHKSDAEAATNIYAEAMRLSLLPVSKEDTIRAPDGADPARPVGFTTEQERAEAVLRSIAALKDGHAGSPVYAAAQGLEAKTLLVLGRYDEARVAFQAAIEGAPSPAPSELQEGLAYATEAAALASADAGAREKGLQDALALFENVSNASGDDASEKALSLYHQGRILGALGRTDDAKAKFEELLSGEPDSNLRTIVESRLALLRAGGGPAATAPAGTVPEATIEAPAGDTP